LAVKPACRKNKQWQALCQKKKWLNLSPAGNVWYCNAKLGKHKLENLLFEISKKQDWLLSTPHTVCEPLL